MGFAAALVAQGHQHVGDLIDPLCLCPLHGAESKGPRRRIDLCQLKRPGLCHEREHLPAAEGLLSKEKACMQGAFQNTSADWGKGAGGHPRDGLGASRGDGCREKGELVGALQSLQCLSEGHHLKGPVQRPVQGLGPPAACGKASEAEGGGGWEVPSRDGVEQLRDVLQETKPRLRLPPRKRPLPQSGNHNGVDTG